MPMPESDLALVSGLAKHVDVEVMVAGGVTSMRDLEACVMAASLASSSGEVLFTGAIEPGEEAISTARLNSHR